MKKVSLLIPAYNEEKVLQLLYQRIKAIIDNLNQYEWEVLFINDGSRDNTLAVLYSIRNQDNRINVLDLSRNYGKEVAMLAGFDYVKGDDVYAKRNSRKGETFIKKKTSQWFYKILQKSTDIPIQLNTGDFRLLDKS